ncbi:MAG: SDR family oxidoreductase, partial [candidate division KSB1 bacterium]|nr:SDR family oxidoreductase [candidate division KSB1 bacterium]
MRLVGKTILITGASSGIGREIARQLAEKQNRLILIARRKELLESLAAEVKSCNADLQLFSCDVADAEQVRKVCGMIRQHNDYIDLLLLNAGLSLPFDAEKIDLPSFHRVMDVNFWGAVHFIEQLTPLMIRQGGGIIAAVGSLAGYRGMPGAAAYSCSKAALMNLIDSLRIDLYAHRIRCTLISPGFV